MTNMLPQYDEQLVISHLQSSLELEYENALIASSINSCLSDQFKSLGCRIVKRILASLDPSLGHLVESTLESFLKGHLNTNIECQKLKLELENQPERYPNIRIAIPALKREFFCQYCLQNGKENLFHKNSALYSHYKGCKFNINKNSHKKIKKAKVRSNLQVVRTLEGKKYQNDSATAASAVEITELPEINLDVDQYFAEYNS